MHPNRLKIPYFCFLVGSIFCLWAHQIGLACVGLLLAGLVYTIEKRRGSK